MTRFRNLLSHILKSWGHHEHRTVSWWLGDALNHWRCKLAPFAPHSPSHSPPSLFAQKTSDSNGDQESLMETPFSWFQNPTALVQGISDGIYWLHLPWESPATYGVQKTWRSSCSSRAFPPPYRCRRSSPAKGKLQVGQLVIIFPVSAQPWPTLESLHQQPGWKGHPSWCLTSVMCLWESWKVARIYWSTREGWIS